MAQTAESADARQPSRSAGEAGSGRKPAASHPPDPPHPRGPEPRAAGRTSGMTTLAAFHIGIGALGVLASCVLLIVWVSFLFPSHFMLVQSPAAAILPRKATAVLAIVMALLRATGGVLLIVAGVRVLDVAPAGRRLSMIAAFLWTFINVTEFFAYDLFVYPWSIFWFLGLTAYPVIIELLFLRRAWRDAFSGDGS